MSVPAPALDGLHDILSPRIRQAVYVAYALLGVVIGATQVGYLTVAGSDALPQWLKVVLAVYAFLSAPVLAIAASNVKRTVALPEPARVVDLDPPVPHAEHLLSPREQDQRGF